MLDLKYVRENLDLVRSRIADRRMDLDLAEFSELENRRRGLIAEVEDLRAERNRVSQEIPRLKKACRNLYPFQA